MAPNRRGPDKQKRQRAPATSKQIAKTQKKRHDNRLCSLATAAEGTARLDAFGIRRTNQGELEDTGPGAVDDAASADDDSDHGASSANAPQVVDRTAVGGSQQNATSSSATAPLAGGHMAGSGSQQNATNLSSNITQTGGCIPCTPAVFNPPPVVAETDADDDDIDLDEDEDDEGYCSS